MSGGIDDHLEVLKLHIHQRRGAVIDEQAPYKVDIAIDRVIEEVARLRKIEKEAHGVIDFIVKTGGFKGLMEACK